MARIIWTAPAYSDLQAILEYIALDKPASAMQLALEISNLSETLGLYPKMGKEIEGNFDEKYREIFIHPCRLFYRLENSVFVILAVRRMERDRVWLC